MSHEIDEIESDIRNALDKLDILKSGKLGNEIEAGEDALYGFLRYNLDEIEKAIKG